MSDGVTGLILGGLMLVGILYLMKRKVKKEVKIYGEDKIRNYGEREKASSTIIPRESDIKKSDSYARPNDLQDGNTLIREEEIRSDDGNSETTEEYSYPIPDLE